MTRKRRIVGLLFAALLGSLLVTGCGASCEDNARDEYFNQQKAVANGGGDVPSVTDMMVQADQYATAQCAK